jgi:hypothetical protein
MGYSHSYSDNAGHHIDVTDHPKREDYYQFSCECGCVWSIKKTATHEYVEDINQAHYKYAKKTATRPD